MLSELYTGDVGVVPYGTDVKNISMNMQDMQLLENRKFSVPEIARFLGVPTTMLMETTNSNYKTSEHATLELFRTLAASIHEEELEYTSKLIGEEGFGVLKIHLEQEPLTDRSRHSQRAEERAGHAIHRGRRHVDVIR